MSQQPRLPRFGTKGVLVIGDVMLDRYWNGGVSRISPEAPVPVVNIDQIEERPGGAGNVALNLATLGCPVWLIGATGEDEAANMLKKQLEGAGACCHFLEYAQHPTITKLRILSKRQQLLRLDFEERFCIDTSCVAHKVEALLGNAGVCLLSDYGKGMLAEPQHLIQMVREKNIPVIIDPKGNDFSRYSGATLLTPNMSEFVAVVGSCPDEKTLVQKGQDLCKKLNLEAVLVTRSEHGMTLVYKNEEELHFPTQAKEVYDVTGAGDTVIATLAAGIAAGERLPEAVSLANIAAGVVVGKTGTAAISAPELGIAIHHYSKQNGGNGVVSPEQLIIAINEARDRNEIIIFASGSFDILHPEDMDFLKKASMLGDRLIIAVNDDIADDADTPPVNSLERRMNVLAELKWVDWVIPLSSESSDEILKKIKPDILVERDQTQADLHEIVIKNNGRVVFL